MQDETLTKVCTKCGEEKMLEAFTTLKRSPDGRVNDCKTCRAAKKRERIASDAILAEKLREENRAFYKRKGPFVQEKNNKRKERYWSDEEFRESHKERQKEINAKLWANPDYREKVLGVHRHRYASDPIFAGNCQARWEKSRLLRRENEEFDAFMERMEQEQAEWEANQADHLTTTEEGDLNGTRDPR